jgi:membrane protein implicated in regulation of membrane protease activity
MPLVVSPVSRLAAILLIILGIFTLVFVLVIAGIAILVLGIVLYWLLYRFSARVERELDAKEPSKRKQASA